MEKWKTKTTFPTFPHGARDDDYKSPVLQNLKFKKGSRPLRGLLIPILFRIILYWNRILVSGSFFDWKMLGSLQAAVGFNPPRARRTEVRRRLKPAPHGLGKAPAVYGSEKA
jgi:hypothetical protein